jgi:methyl-accepting chemotaxis protein
MYQRESNRRLMAVFLLCAATITVITWTLREKYIPDPVTAFFVNLAVSAAVALLFERFVEFRLNVSVDALIEKLRKVREGDLTQRFKENPEDYLPYGLSFELGGLMAFFRDNIGGLWKVSASLSRQLGQLVEASQALIGEFRSETECLARIGGHLDEVRSEISDISRRVSDLKVSSANDSAYLEQINTVTQRTASDIVRHRKVISGIRGDFQSIIALMEDLSRMIRELEDLYDKVTAVQKSLAGLSTESGLVKLNASIDSSQMASREANFGKLLEELHLLASRISEIKQGSADMAGLALSRIGNLWKRLHAGDGKIREGLENIERTRAGFEHIGSDMIAVGSHFGSVFENIQRLAGLMNEVDARTIHFNENIKKAAQIFDKLSSDSQITLLRFNQLSEKTAILLEGLKSLDEFKNRFQIA